MRLDVRKHVLQDRWPAYTSGGGRAEVIEAWEGGLPLTDHGLDADEARYDPREDVVLIRHGSRLVTVINNDDSIRPETREAILQSLIMFGDGRLDR